MPDEIDSMVADTLRDRSTAVGSTQPIQRLNYSHKAMIDLILANPGISQNEIAARFGYSASWVSQIFSADAFQTQLAERTKDIVDPALRATVEQNFKAIIIRSQAILMEKLNGTAETVSDNLTMRALELGSRALGYGAREPAPPTSVNVEVHLEQLSTRMAHLLDRRKAEAIEGESTDVTL